MERELRDLVDLVSPLEQATRGLVPQVVEAQVLDPQDLQARVKAAPTLFGSYGKMYSLSRGCAMKTAHASGVYLNLRRFPSFFVGCFASRTIPVRQRTLLSRHSMRQISDSRRAELTANSMIGCNGISARLARRAK